MHLRQPCGRADAGLSHRRGAGPQHARADPPLACRRPPLPRVPIARSSTPSAAACRAASTTRCCGAPTAAVHAEYSSYPIVDARPGARRGGDLRRHQRARARRGAAAQDQRRTGARASATHARADATRWRNCASSDHGRDGARARAHAHRARDPRRARLAAGGAEDGHRTGSAAPARRRAARSWSAKCQRMGRLIDTAVDNVGRIITDLRPSILDHQGLWAALEWQAQEFIESSRARRRPAAARRRRRRAARGGWRSRCFASSRRCSPTWRATRRREAWIRIDVDGRRSRCCTSTCATMASAPRPQAPGRSAQLRCDGHARARRAVRRPSDDRQRAGPGHASTSGDAAGAAAGARRR